MSAHAQPNGDAVLTFRSVSLVRNGNELLSNLNWTVQPKDRWVVLGPNGAGKTTLLSMAAGRLHPTRGNCWILGEQLGKVDVFELRPRIGFSSAHLGDRVPGAETVLNYVLTAAYAVVGRFAEDYHSVDDSRAHFLLDQLDIAHLANRSYATLSEGERKRAHIARALMTDPELLLLDEPAAGLDLGAREDLLQRLSGLAADQVAPALVLVTHHVEEIPLGTTHVLLLRQGQVVAAGDINTVLTDQNLSATFNLPITVHNRDGRFYAQAA